MNGERRKVWKGLIFAVLFVMLAFVSVGCASAGVTHYVNPGESIQAAVDAANSGDTVIVRDGTYTENVEVNVANLTLRSENGSANCFVTALDQNDHVFNVTANWVNISGFMIQNATGTGKAGIYLNNVDHCTISENNASNNMYGIFLSVSSYNILTDNTATSNSWNGIYLYSSSNNNNLTGNTVSNNNYGIILDSSSNNNTVSGNYAYNNNQGIHLDSSSNNNTISDNTAYNNSYGIFLYFSNNNTLTDNNVFNNSNNGIVLISSSNSNRIYNNYFDNTNNAIDSGNNIWNITKIQGKNIVGGSWLGGNYWNDYTGDDTNGDGLGDTLLPYNSLGYIQNGGDWLPLVIVINQPPTALIDSITPNPAKQGKDTVSFIGHGNDSDGSILAYTWTSDIDGMLNTSPSFTIPASELSVGTHTIYFTVQDDYGARSPAATENLTIITNQPPVASFTYSPVNPTINENVTFNASASYDPDVNITSYNWSFGDGNSTNTTGSTILHPYASVGEYTVNLTVTDDEGAMNKTSRVIKVFSDVPYLDTEPGTYPSICGTHNGTIEMTHTINVSTICVYSCPGTGGHIEYAKIWNSSWEGTEAHWQGYVGDWHNCSFDKNFTLVAGETYNYTIITGSYPQIIHASSKAVTGGTITCTEFVDVNGKTYTDWIPAITLCEE